MIDQLDTFDEEALLSRLCHALRERQQEIVFLLGSPLSAPIGGGAGVPTATGIIEMIRKEFATSGEESAFNAAIDKSSGLPYQAAFKFLVGRRGQDAANTIVQRAVLKSRKSRARVASPTDFPLSKESCQALETDKDGWHLGPGLVSIGKLAKILPNIFGGTVLTTNFDPCIELAIRSQGALCYRTSLSRDGNVGQTVADGCHVIHLHGYWWGSDTLHTATQLTQERPRLSAALASLLQNKLLVVSGYGGWDDVITRTLFEVVQDDSAQFEVLWLANSQNPALDPLLEERLRTGMERSRILLYAGIDCNTFFPKVLSFWEGHLNSRTGYASKRSQEQFVTPAELISERVDVRPGHRPLRKNSLSSSTLQLSIYDGARTPFVQPIDILITIIAGNQETLFSGFKRGNSFTFHLPLFDNLFDQYRVIVSADGYSQTGFAPVKLTPAHLNKLDLMLLSYDPGYNFVSASWDTALLRYPFLADNSDTVTARARYEMMLEKHENVLACFLNLVEALSQISLQTGTPLDYIQQLRWDKAPTQDRFFAYCDAKLVDQVKQAAAVGQFAEQPNPAVFHPGATASWKQIRFGEANLRLTFHQAPPDCKKIKGVDCVTVELDFDFYKDLAAHTIFEVIPNALTNTLTNPVEVYVLRWIVGQQPGLPQFEPLYTLL